MRQKPLSGGIPRSLSRSTGRVVATLALAVLFAVGTGPVQVRAEPGVGPAHIDRSLDDVAVSSPAVDTAVRDLEATRAALDRDRDRLHATRERIDRLRSERDRLTERIGTDTRIRDDAEAEVVVLSARLRGFALRAYVGIGHGSAEDAAWNLDGAAALSARSSATLRDTLVATSHRAHQHQRQIADAAAGRLAEAARDLTRTEEELTAARARVAETEAAIERNRIDALQGLAELRRARATATVDGTDLPLVVLDAYVTAARRANARTPGCHLHWSLLAGIGEVESGQGTHGGARVLADGTLTRPIHGIPLDGSHDTEVIPDGDGGHVRAEGPMQFLPSTWAFVATDGDGDGRADIQNLYDAAATAGTYLCLGGVDLRNDADLRRAILAYNFSGAYVAEVTRGMRRYAEALPEVPAG